MKILKRIAKNILFWFGISLAGYLLILIIPNLFATQINAKLKDGLIVLWVFLSYIATAPITLHREEK